MEGLLHEINDFVNIKVNKYIYNKLVKYHKDQIQLLKTELILNPRKDSSFNYKDDDIFDDIDDESDIQQHVSFINTPTTTKHIPPPPPPPPKLFVNAPVINTSCHDQSHSIINAIVESDDVLCSGIFDSCKVDSVPVRVSGILSATEQPANKPIVKKSVFDELVSHSKQEPIVGSIKRPILTREKTDSYIVRDGQFIPLTTTSSLVSDMHLVPPVVSVTKTQPHIIYNSSKASQSDSTVESALSTNSKPVTNDSLTLNKVSSQEDNQTDVESEKKPIRVEDSHTQDARCPNGHGIYFAGIEDSYKRSESQQEKIESVADEEDKQDAEETKQDDTANKKDIDEEEQEDEEEADEEEQDEEEDVDEEEQDEEEDADEEEDEEEADEEEEDGEKEGGGEVDEEGEGEEEGGDELEVVEFEYEGKMYYVENTKNSPIYMKDDAGDVGEEVGEIIDGVVKLNG